MSESRKREHFYIRSVGGLNASARQELWGAEYDAASTLDLEIQTIQQDLNMVKAAKEALDHVERVLTQIRALTLEAVDAEEFRRDQIHQEMELLDEAMDKIIANASYNGLNLLDGSMGSISSILAQIRSNLGA